MIYYGANNNPKHNPKIIPQQAIPPTHNALKVVLYRSFLSIMPASANIPINEKIAIMIRNTVIINTSLQMLILNQLSYQIFAHKLWQLLQLRHD